jgi:hypothetical protein
MGDYAHVTAWRGIRTGRERQAMELWGEALTFYEKAKANSLIDDYEVQLFMPSGGALPNGMILLYGSQDQVDAIARNDERGRLQAKAGLLLDGLVETSMIRGAAVLEGIGTFNEVVEELS